MNQQKYSLDFHARAIAPVAGASESSFYVGTCEVMSPSSDTNNIISIVDQTESGTLDALQTWNVDGEVWKLCPCPAPAQADLLCAILSPRSAPTRRCATFYRASPSNTSLTVVHSLPSSLGRVADVLWDCDGLADRALCVSNTGVHVLKVSSTVSVARSVDLPPPPIVSAASPTSPSSPSALASTAAIAAQPLAADGAGGDAPPGGTGTGAPEEASVVGTVAAAVAAAWDPNHSETVAVGVGRDIQFVDLRVGAVAGKGSGGGGGGGGGGGSGLKSTVGGAHIGGVSCLSYDPLALYKIVSGGLDSALRLWDSRNMSAPLVTLDAAHAHWVTTVSANQHSATPDSSLFVSASTDGSCKVWWLADGARNPLLHATDAGESVYSAAWGCSAWVFGRVMFDGSVVVERLPRALVDGLLLKERSGGGEE